MGPNLECVRWIQKPLVTHGTACLPATRRIFFEGVFAAEKKTSGSGSIDASRLIFQSAVLFKNRLDAKKQAGPTSLFFGTQAVKTSEFIERTLSFSGPLRGPCIIVKFCFQTTKFWFQTDRRTDGRTDRQTQ